jgi:uncharacterized membrane protein YfcA
MPILVAVAVFAGALTTISGFGGGILLLLAVTAFVGAKAALAATAMALLVANVHRIWLYRREVGAHVTVPLLVGLVPGSLAGALVASWIPEAVVHAVMLAVVALSLARVWLGWEWKPGRHTLSASGFVVGVLAGSAGGAGFLVGPIVLAAGLIGRPYLATVAVSAVAMHVGRIAGYGAGGLLSEDIVRLAAVLAPALLVGNLLGNHVRDWIPDAWQRGIEIAAPVVCVALAFAGLG